jgi:hypothetical protein
MNVNLDASEMAFVWDQSTKRENLYALVDKVLVVLDPVTWTRTPIARPKLNQDTRGLVATREGRLFAFSVLDVTGAVAVVSEIRRADAFALAQWNTSFPDEQLRFAGGIPHANGFQLVFGTKTWAYDIQAGSIQPSMPLFQAGTVVLSVSSSPCEK